MGRFTTQLQADTRRLYQCFVESAGGRIIPVGPRMNRAAITELASEIRKAEKAGMEKSWHNPTVCEVTRDGKRK